MKKINKIYIHSQTVEHNGFTAVSPDDKIKTEARQQQATDQQTRLAAKQQDRTQNRLARAARIET